MLYLAQICATPGINVVKVDISETAVAKGMATVAGSFDRFLKKERITAADKAAALARIKGSTRSEYLKVKILKQFDAIAPADVIIASSTPSISITKLADMVGLDVCLAVMEVYLAEFGDSKYRPFQLLREMVAAGRLGRKTGRAVYLY